MKVEYCYNYNEASGSRGASPDVPNETQSLEVESVEEAVAEILAEVYGISEEEWLEGDELTPEDLISYANDADVTGGDTILFWFEIDGQRYETQWVDSIDEFSDDDEEGDGVNVNFLATWRPDDDTDDVDIIECDDIVEAINEMVKRTRFEGVGTGTVIINITDDDGESIDDDEAEEIVGYDDFDTLVTFTNEDGLWNNTGDFTEEYSEFIYNNGEDELLESKKKTNKNKLTEDDAINRIQNIFNTGDVFVNEQGAEISVFDVGENDVSYKVMSPGKSFPDAYCTDKDSLCNCLNQNHYKVREKRTVKVTFQNDEDAEPFKDEMKSKFKFPKTQSKREVVHGKSKSGGSVFVEKKLREAGASFGETFAMGEAEFAKWLNATKGMTALEVYNEPDIGCTLVYIKDPKALGGVRHIGTYNHDRQVLFCDDVSYFGRVIENKKVIKKNHSLKENEGFISLGEWIENNISDEDFADFNDFVDEVFGVDFTYENPNVQWAIDELNEMKSAWLEEMGEDVGNDPEMSSDLNEDVASNVELAYRNWLSLQGPELDVSNYDAFEAGAALSNVVATEDQYSEWLEQYAPDYDVSNYDAFEAGAKLGYEGSAIDDFSAATPYKERTVTESKKKVNEADISKVKKFNTPYFDKLCSKVFEVMDAYEGETPEYDAYNSLYDILNYTGRYLNTNHEATWGLKKIRAKLYRLVNDPVEYFGLSANNGAEGFSEEFFQSCYEEGLLPFIRKYVTDPQLIEALDYVENTVVANIDVEKADKYNAKVKAESDARQAKWAAEAAKRDEESKFLADAAKKANVTIDEVESFVSTSEWSVILDTEDEDEANDFRNEVGEVLGAENTLGASYDDIQGMADIHLGCLQYYEWSEMNGGDVYEDLREDLRNKYVVFACPKQDWVDYRRQNDW